MTEISKYHRRKGPRLAFSFSEVFIISVPTAAITHKTGPFRKELEFYPRLSNCSLKRGKISSFRVHGSSLVSNNKSLNDARSLCLIYSFVTMYVGTIWKGRRGPTNNWRDEKNHKQLRAWRISFPIAIDFFKTHTPTVWLLFMPVSIRSSYEAFWVHFCEVGEAETWNLWLNAFHTFSSGWVTHM